MGKIFKFEIYKLLKKKLFVVLFVFLILGNLLATYMYEQHQLSYYYIYEGREQYEAFLNGDESVDADDFYIVDKQKQEEYAQTYYVFLDGMEERAKLLYGIYGEDSFVYRNAQKTCEDFAKLSEVEIKRDNCYGIVEYIQYDIGIFFLFAFLIILVYFVFYEERNKGLFLLVKGTAKGHGAFVVGKIGSMLLFAVLYTLIQEVLNIILFKFLYGYGDVERSIQSVSEFRNCPLDLTVFETFVYMIGIRVFIAVLLVMLVAWIGVVARNEITAIIVGGAILVVEALFYHVIYISSPINVLKCINPYFFWNMQTALGTYLNINVFGFAIGKDVCATIVCAMMLCVCMIGALVCFHKICQIRTQSKLEELQIWLRKKTGCLWRHTNLLRFELKKVFVQQKKGIVVGLLLILCLSNVCNTKEYYNSAFRVTYNQYMKQLAGRVTEDSITFVQKEKAYIDEVRELWLTTDTTTGDGYAQSLMLRHELDMKEEAVEKLVSQLEMLQSMEGSISDKYWVNELAYTDLWYDAKTDIVWWFMGAMLLVVWISGIYPMDEKKGLIALLSSTKYGRSVLRRKKNLCVVLGMAVMFVLAQLPTFVRYYRIDGFRCVAQKICHFTNLGLDTEWTIGLFLLLVYILKFLTFVIVTFLALYVSRKTRNEMITNAIAIGTVGVIALVCLCLSVSISSQMLRFLYEQMM